MYFPYEDFLFLNGKKEAQWGLINKVQVANRIKTLFFLFFYQGIEGIKAILSRIWGLSEKEVILTKGVTIPTQQILKIDYENDNY